MAGVAPCGRERRGRGRSRLRLVAELQVADRHVLLVRHVGPVSAARACWPFPIGPRPSSSRPRRLWRRASGGAESPADAREPPLPAATGDPWQARLRARAAAWHFLRRVRGLRALLLVILLGWVRSYRATPWVGRSRASGGADGGVAKWATTTTWAACGVESSGARRYRLPRKWEPAWRGRTWAPDLPPRGRPGPVRPVGTTGTHGLKAEPAVGVFPAEGNMERQIPGASPDRGILCPYASTTRRGG